MAEKIKFQVQPRVIHGKQVSQLRRQGLVPANISGNVDKTVGISVEASKFTHLYDKVGDTGLFYLIVDGEKNERPVLISEVQHHPVTGKVLHVVFRQVDLTEKITAEVPVELVGEFAIKGAVVVTLHDSVEVEALPQNFPDKFVVDVTKFEAIGDTVTYKDLEFDRSKVTLMIDQDQLEEPIVLVQEVKEEVEPEPVPVEEGTTAAATTPPVGAEGEAPASTPKEKPTE